MHERAPHTGGAIIVAGRPVPTGARVIGWKDDGGLDAYRTARIDATGAPDSYGTRRDIDGRPIAAGDMDALRRVVDQIVLHHDGIGSSHGCFEMLRERKLSAHFLIDIDGTVYQTLDVQERAYHATVANNRSIGIEIANLGAFPASEMEGGAPLAERRENLPRTQRIHGSIHGVELVQESFTEDQYIALAKLVDALCRTLPLIERRVPLDANGLVVTTKLSEAEFEEFRGILGHFHIQENKVDPGPAFRWERALKP